MTLESLIADTADRHHLAVRLVRAIVQVESAGCPWAVRYEPAFFRTYVESQNHPVYRGCSRDTEERLRATSFGLMQIMGQTARERGFEGPFLTELCDPALGLEYGCRHLVRQIQRYQGDLMMAVAAYNAGSARRDPDGSFRNQGYVDKVKKAGEL